MESSFCKDKVSKHMSGQGWFKNMNQKQMMSSVSWMVYPCIPNVLWIHGSKTLCTMVSNVFAYELMGKNVSVHLTLVGVFTMEWLLQLCCQLLAIELAYKRFVFIIATLDWRYWRDSGGTQQQKICFRVCPYSQGILTSTLNLLCFIENGQWMGGARLTRFLPFFKHCLPSNWNK